MARLQWWVLVAAVLLLPARSFAQSGSTGAIAGTARDTSGAVLPGVTVEAASPALIEKVRTGVTDAQGNYKITELRPGTYIVTFTLTGFGTYRRENVELNAGVTAAVNADMKVGALEETVTVTGASPVVDVQNVRKQTVLTREVLDVIPTGKTIQGFATLTLGARGSGSDGGTSTVDVGGNKGEGNAGFGVHGMRGEDSVITQDGMFANAIIGSGNTQNKMTQINQAFVQEMTILTSGIGAESQTGGVQINIVPREGSNQFKLYFNTSGAGSSFQNSNLDADLIARGVTTAPKILKVWDIAGALGGPIKHDKLWFFTAHRYWGAGEIVPGDYYNKTQGTFVYTPDLSRPAHTYRTNRDDSVRLTWQVTPKSKLAVNYSNQFICNCFNTVNGTPPTAPEAAINGPKNHPQLTQGVWNYPATSHLLLEAGATYSHNPLIIDREDGVTFTTVPIIEQTTNFRYNAWTQGITFGRGYTNPDLNKYTNQTNQRFSVSYISGSHALKAGFTVLEGFQPVNVQLNEVPGVGPVVYTLRNGSPVSLTQYASPFDGGRSVIPHDLAIFAQDQWTTRRLTANLGLRYDAHAESVDPLTTPNMAFIGSASFPAVNNVVGWKDLSPRLGVTYDLFGNAKTAIKASVGRYTQVETTALADANQPVRRIANNATRTWVDGNGNLFPDCDLNNRLANGECGQINNLAFGSLVNTNSFDTAILKGFDVRPEDWQVTAGLQHELRPGMALNAGYYRAWYGNFTVADNLLTTPADFDPFCITAPTDSRLGSVSGQQLCGLYDVRPAKFGQVNTNNTFASNFGKQTQVYNGFEVAMQARFKGEGLIQGGMSTGRTDTNNCFVVDSPQGSATTPGVRSGYCDQVLPYKGQTQLKFAGVYPLPYGVRFSGTFQTLPGIPLSADFTATNAQVAPSLGRNLAAGAAGTVTVPLLPANVLYEKRLNQLDIRFTKIVKVGASRWQGMFDIYNALNGNSVLTANSAYGPTWLRPTSIMGGRLFKFTGQLDW